MDASETVTALLGVVGTATAVGLALTEQYAAVLAALAAYTVAWLLLRESADRST